MKKMFLLGATGSIGLQVLDVVRTLKDIEIVSISFGNNIEKAKEIIDEFKPKYVSCMSRENASTLKSIYKDIEIEDGLSSLIKAATYGDDSKDCYVLNAVVGMVGLRPTIEAIKLGRTILLANKETLVVGGELIESMKKDYDVKLIPIDSEHSAIMQCLSGRKKEEVSELIITASGGAFRDKTRSELESVTIIDALKHPNWAMGKKITVDCATMVNKGLEVIEAHFLFGIDYENIKTVLHFESIVHSMVKYKDASIIAQMAKPDMRIPIQDAITYPNKQEYKLDDCLDIYGKSLTFKKMDFERYPMLELAYEVGKMGGLMPTIYNSSNEVANKLFCDGKISFLDIEKLISNACDYFMHQNKKNNTLDDILKMDELVRLYINKNYKEILK